MVKETNFERAVDEIGRVVLPQELRKILNIIPKQTLKVLIDEENECIILKK